METEFQNQIIAGAMVGALLGFVVYDMLLTVIKWLKDKFVKPKKRGDM